MEKSKRNSLIELLRFIFAFFILFYHDLFVVNIPIFQNANYFLDFFFIISGMYLTKMFAKYDEFSPVKGGYKLLIDRLIKFGIPLLICYIASVACDIFSVSNTMNVHYLWFIHILLICYLIFYILWRIFRKNKFYFYYSIGIIMFIAIALRYGCLIHFNLPHWNNFFEETYWFDELRALVLIPLGMFLSLIPNIKFKNDQSQKQISLCVIIVSLIVLVLTLFVSYRSVYYKRIIETIADFVLFPSICYFAKFVSFDNKICNILGESSLYLYIYQSIGCLEGTIGVTNKTVLFASIIIAVLITMIWKYEYRKRKLINKQVIQ